MTDKPHFSPSQLDSASKCGMRYYYSYIEHLKIPPGFAAVRGTGYHAGAEHNFSQKIGTHRDLPKDDIVEVAVSKVKQEVERGITLSDEEESEGKDNVVGRLVDSTATMSAFFCEDVAPDYQPTHVEVRSNIALPGDYDLLGVVDLIDDQNRVVDYKTGNKKRSQAEADTSIQLTTYGIVARGVTGKDCSLFLDTVVDYKKGPARHVLETTRTERDTVVLAARMNALANMIKTGSFHPAPVDAWWCSKKWCGYSKMCPYFSGRD